MDWNFPRRGDEVKEALGRVKYAPGWIQEQDDDTLLREIKNLSDFDYDMAGVSWLDRLDAVNEIARSLLFMRAQREVREYEGPLRRRK